MWGLGAPDEGKGKRERERGGEVGVGKPCRLNRPGGGSVDRGALARGGGGTRWKKPEWGIRVDQLGSPATRGSLTEKCRESRTVGRVFDPRC